MAMPLTHKQQVEAGKVAKKLKKQRKKQAKKATSTDAGAASRPSQIFESRGVEYHPCVHFVSSRANKIQCRKTCTDRQKVHLCNQEPCRCEWRICPRCADQIGALKAVALADKCLTMDFSSGLCFDHSNDLRFDRRIGQVPEPDPPKPTVEETTKEISTEAKSEPEDGLPYKVITAPSIRVGEFTIQSHHERALKAGAEVFAQSFNSDEKPPFGAPILMADIDPFIVGQHTRTTFPEEELIELASNMFVNGKLPLLKVRPHQSSYARKWQLLDTDSERVVQAAKLNEQQFLLAHIAGVAEDTERFKRQALRAKKEASQKPPEIEADPELSVQIVPDNGQDKSQKPTDSLEALVAQFGLPREMPGVKIIGVVMNIPPHMIKPMPDQPRKEFDRVKLLGLGESMQTVGQKVPILVVHDPDDSGQPFQLEDGERRWRAANLVGLEFLQAISTKDPDYAAQYITSITANFGREEHTHLEVARGLQTVMKLSPEITQHQLPAVCGRSAQWVREHLSILELPDEVVAMMEFDVPEAKRLTYAAAKQLVAVRAASPKVRTMFAHEIINQEIPQSKIRGYLQRRVQELSTKQGMDVKVRFRGHTPREDYNKLCNAVDGSRSLLEHWLKLDQEQRLKLFIHREKPLADIRTLKASIAQLLNDATVLERLFGETETGLKHEIKRRAEQIR